MLLKLTLKWQNKLFDNITVDTEESIDIFKNKICELTGVPTSRQKLMSSKNLIKSQENFESLKDGDKILLIGTAEGKELAVHEKTVFIEDLSELEKKSLMLKKKIRVPPLGLINLNTVCYLNAILQFLKPCSEFLDLAKQYQRKSNEDSQSNLNTASNKAAAYDKVCESIQQLYRNLTSETSPVSSHNVVEALREACPQFSQKNTSGTGYMQQDAEECLSNILSIYADRVNDKQVNSIFGFEMKSEIINSEQKDEKEEKIEKFRKISCYMGTQLSPVNTVEEGIQLSLKTQMEKFSNALNKNCVHDKISSVHTLPKYLILHFVRFEWKKANDLARTEAGRAKVCRKVLFSNKFDIYPFCSKELQEKLRVGRMIEAERRNKEVKRFDNDSEKEVEARKKEKLSETKDDETNEDDIQKKKKVKNEEGEDAEIELCTGNYKLLSVVTHQGRSADVGHYICWCKAELDEDKNEESEKERNANTRKGAKGNDELWFKIDDSNVTEHAWKNVDLCGGRSDYHIAFLNMYKQETILVTKNEYERFKNNE